MTNSHQAHPAHPAHPGHASHPSHPGHPGQHGRLSRAGRFAYAAPAFALACVGIPIYVQLPKFYTDVVGVPVGLVGLLMMASRVFDAVLDPLVGRLSDRTATRWGRRRPYIAGASPLLALCLFGLFSPPLGHPALANWWFGIGLFLVFLAWTAIMVPYEALGPELSFDYDERTSLLALRDGALLLGTLVAAASPTLLSALLRLGVSPEDEATKFRAVAFVYGPLIIAACLWCAASLREKPRPPIAFAPAGTRATLGAMLANRPFLILIASYTAAALGSNLPGTLILFYVQYVLESESSDLFMLLYLGTGIAFLPVWVWVARRAEKKTAWLVATAINTSAFFGVYFLGAGDAPIYAVMVVISGIGFGATVAIPSSMQADVIDYDELLSGERREGSYLGIWSVARKFAAALGVGIGLTILDHVGYTPNAVQSIEVKRTLAALYALFPCACNALGFALALGYPIGRREHLAIREAIAARAQGLSVVDPLRPGLTLLPRGSAATLASARTAWADATGE